MKFSIKYHKVFKKDLKPFKNDSALIAELRAVIVKLANDEILEPKYKDHALKGDFITVYYFITEKAQCQQYF